MGKARFLVTVGRMVAEEAFEMAERLLSGGVGFGLFLPAIGKNISERSDLYVFGV